MVVAGVTHCGQTNNVGVSYYFLGSETLKNKSDLYL